MIGTVVASTVVPPPRGALTMAIVGGNSMEPMLETGDLVIAARWGDVTIGDVVVVESAGGYVVHRVVAGDEDRGWVTQGDANPFRDRFPIADADVLGEPVLVIPGVGLVTGWMHANPLRLATIVTAAYLLVSLQRGQRRTKSERSGCLVHSQ